MFLYALKILFLFFEIKSSDYRDGVYVKLKYLNLYDYIFNLVSSEESHFGFRKNMFVLHQNKS